MNLLNNAIEENEKIELTGRRGIWINMKEKDHGAVWLQVRNHIRHTEKKKQEEYGIGREILERNLLDQNGANCDSHAIFCVKIWKCYWEKEKDFGI